MKTQSAVIKAVMLTRANAKGDYPIAIRVYYKGRVMKSLPIALPKNKWNEDKGVVVKTYPNAAMMNKIINDEIQKVRGRELDLQAKGEVYTAKDLLFDDNSNSNYNSNKTSDLDFLVADLTKERALKPNSVKSYNQIVKWVKEYYCKGKDSTIKLEQINGDNIQAFCKWMTDTKGCSHASVQSVCNRIAALHRYASELGVVNENTYPFKKFKYWKIYKYGGDKPALTEEQLLNIESYLASEFFTYDENGTIYYKNPNYEKRLYVKSSEEFTLTMYLACYYFQGLALCDLAELKYSQFKLKHGTKTVTTNHETYIDYNGQKRKAIVPITEEVNYDYYTIEGVKRSKTRQDVPIVIEITTTIECLLNHYISTSNERDGYIFPIFTHDGMTDEEKGKVLASAYNLLNTTLQKVVAKVNDRAHKYRTEHGLQDDWTDIPEDLTFYSARHTFASIMATKGVANADLAKMMGRTIQGIDNYIHQLHSSEQLLKAKQGKGI